MGCGLSLRHNGCGVNIVAGMHDGNLDDCLGLRRLDQAFIFIMRDRAWPCRDIRHVPPPISPVMHLGAPVMQVAKRCVELPAPEMLLYEHLASVLHVE